MIADETAGFQVDVNQRKTSSCFKIKSASKSFYRVGLKQGVFERKHQGAVVAVELKEHAAASV